jgi:hypothetical protein
MTEEQRLAAKRAVEALRERADSLSDGGPNSPEFIHWYADVIDTLTRYFGENYNNLKEFRRLRFQLSPEAVDAFRRMSAKIRVISRRDQENVTRLQTLEQAIEESRREMEKLGVPQRNPQFENALSEAKVVLLCVLLDLRN